MNVQLRPVTQELIDILPQWAQREDLKEYFRAWPALADWNRPDLVAQKLDWAYGLYEDDTLVGLVQFCYPNIVARTIEYGILVDSTRVKERKGLNLKAYALIEDYVFNRLGYNKIYVRVLEHRTELIQKMLSIGAHQEGRLLKSAKLNGEYCNEVIFAKFKE